MTNGGAITVTLSNRGDLVGDGLVRQSFAIDLRSLYEYFDDCDGFFSGEQNRWRTNEWDGMMVCVSQSNVKYRWLS